MKKKIIIISGDPNSINSVIIVKSWVKLKTTLKNRIVFVSNINLLKKQIKKLKIADVNSILIIHRNKKSDDKISQYLNIIEEKNYGLSKIFFCKLIN